MAANRRVTTFLYDGPGEIVGIRQVRLQGTNTVGTGTGATGARPTGQPVGAMFYDITLHKPIWYDGSAWRDASGTIV